MVDFATTRAQVRFLRDIIGIVDLRDGEGIADAVLEWQEEHGALAPHDLGIVCDCRLGDGCDKPAIRTDEGVPVCGGCLDGGSYPCSCCGADTMAEMADEARHAGMQAYMHSCGGYYAASLEEDGVSHWAPGGCVNGARCHDTEDAALAAAWEDIAVWEDT